MSIIPLSMACYRGDLGEAVEDFLDPPETAAISLLGRTLRVDVTQPGQFYEAVVARVVDGKVTDRRAPYDVDCDVGFGPTRLEVKGSKAWLASLRIDGRDYSRDVFRFEVKRSHGKFDFLVLLGQNQGRLWCWLLPAEVVRPSSRWMTICAPWSRMTGERGVGSGEIAATGSIYDGYAIPLTQLRDALACWSANGVGETMADLKGREADERRRHAASLSRDWYQRNIGAIREKRAARRDAERARDFGPALPGIL